MSDIQQASAQTQMRIAIKVASLSTALIVAAWRFALRQLHKETPGKVSIRKLMRDGAMLQKAQIGDVDLKELSQMAKDYKISFSVVQDLENGGYTVFFQSRRAAQMEACIEAYMRKRLEFEQSLPQREPLRVRMERAQQRQKEQTQERQREPSKEKPQHRQHSQERGERSR